MKVRKRKTIHLDRPLISKEQTRRFLDNHDISIAGAFPITDGTQCDIHGRVGFSFMVNPVDQKCKFHFPIANVLPVYRNGRNPFTPISNENGGAV